MYPLVKQFVETDSKQKNWSNSYIKYVSVILTNMCELIEKQPTEMTFEDLNGYLHYKKETESWSNSLTARNGITVIKQFFRYLVKNKIMEKSPAEKLPYPKWRRDLKNMQLDEILDKEFRKQKKVVDSPYITDRQRALWHLATSNPFMAVDLVNIKKSDLKLEYGKINFNDNGKIIPIFLTEKAIKAIKVYMIKEPLVGEYLFPSKNGGQSPVGTICSQLRSIGKLADPKRELGTQHHGVRTLRKGDIARNIDAGVDLYALLYKLGVKSFKIFDNYILITPRRKIKLARTQRQYESYMKKRHML